MDIKINNLQGTQPIFIPKKNSSPEELLEELKGRHVCFTLNEEDLQYKDIYTLNAYDASGKSLTQYEVDRNSTAFHCMLVHCLKREDPGVLNYLALGASDKLSLPDQLTFLKKFNYALDFALRAMAADPKHQAGKNLVNTIIASDTPEEEQKYELAGDFEQDSALLEALDLEITKDNQTALTLAGLIHLYGSVGNPINLSKAYSLLMRRGEIVNQILPEEARFAPYYHAVIMFLWEKLNTIFEKSTDNRSLETNAKDWKTAFSMEITKNSLDSKMFSPAEERIYNIKHTVVPKYVELTNALYLAKQTINGFNNDPIFYREFLQKFSNELRALLSTYAESLPIEIRTDTESTITTLDNLLQNNNNA